MTFRQLHKLIDDVWGDYALDVVEDAEVDVVVGNDIQCLLQADVDPATNRFTLVVGWS